MSATDSVEKIAWHEACAAAVAAITARIERLPFSTWHIRLVSIVGIAHLLDAFDSQAIALVLPVLNEIWHFTPSQIGRISVRENAKSSLSVV